MADVRVNLPAGLHERQRVRAMVEGRSPSAAVLAILRRVLDPPAAGSRRTDDFRAIKNARHALWARLPRQPLVQCFAPGLLDDERHQSRGTQ